MEKLFYTMSEVSAMLEVPDTTVRFWSDSFPKFVKPQRNAKGNRQFRAGDIDALRQIKYLLKDKGLTIGGATKQMTADRTGVDKTARAITCLEDIRARLVEVRKSL